MISAPSGWDWFEPNAPAGNRPELDDFASCFATPSGRTVLAHLRQHFLERRVPPSATAAELRHHEGARHAIAYIERLVEAGRAQGKENKHD